MMKTGTADRIKVWDPLVRLFHWTLVISFTVAYVTGEEGDLVHFYSGYVIAGLLLFRLVWGFIGSRHARFADFVRSPREVIEYTRSLFSGHPRRYLGHNPAGGVMVILLLLSLSGTVVTGLMLDPAFDSVVLEGSVSNRVLLGDDDEERGEGYEEEDDEREGGMEGPGGEGNEVVEEWHEVLANLTLLLVILHIAGVVVSSRLHRENLVRAMITGYKPRDPEA